jgi:folate-binding protein YgfZ
MHVKIRLDQLGMLQSFIPKSPIHWTWLSFFGKDSADFLNRLTTVNVQGMNENTGAPGCFLDSMGRIKAYFYLWRLSPEQFGFEFDSGKDDHWKESLTKTIEQFTFAEKIQVSSENWSTKWFLGSEDLGLKKYETKELDGVRIFHHGDHTFGRNWYSVWGNSENISKLSIKASSESKLEELEKQRVENLAPWADKEIQTTAMPLEIGLAEAVINKRGCYPGQEVIERVLSVGSPPRRLVKIIGKGSASIGEKLTQVDSTAEIGNITSIAAGQESTSALAIVRKVQAKEGAEVQSGQFVGKIAAIAPER